MAMILDTARPLAGDRTIDVTPDPSPTRKEPTMPMTPEAAKAAVLAETCPCPHPEGHDAGTRMALPVIPAFLAPLAAQLVAQYGPQIVAELTKAAQMGIDALIAKLGATPAPPAS